MRLKAKQPGLGSSKENLHVQMAAPIPLNQQDQGIGRSGWEHPWLGRATLPFSASSPLQQELCTQQESLGARSMLEFSQMNPFSLDPGFSLSPEPVGEPRRFCCAVPRVPTAAPSLPGPDPGATSLRKRSPLCPCPAPGVLSQPGAQPGRDAAFLGNRELRADGSQPPGV